MLPTSKDIFHVQISKFIQMEHCLNQFHFVYWVQKFVHVDWVGRVDFFYWVDRFIWECAGDRLISECAEYHVGTFVVGCDGTWEAVGLSCTQDGCAARC